MLLLIECLLACAVFTLIIVPAQIRNPISQIVSYPPEIQERVRSLPQYKDIVLKASKKNIARKIIGALLLTFVLAALAYFSGKVTFLNSAIHVYIVFTAVNLYDLIVLDWLWFAHSSKTRIPGTKDMVKAYHGRWHHFRGFLIGLGIGLPIAMLSAVWVVVASGLVG
ncbi:MAG: hypothetical protein LBS74_01535 [Oscillospiraceae bacterium]|jgi:hypothetical protein|nr:hypothetical protein [Oscillospiraceae bacterium]